MRRIARLVAAFGLVAPMLAAGTAHSATPCVTSAEFRSLAQFALPSIVDGARLRCQNNVPANAFLRTGAIGAAQRFRQGSAQAWPQAKAVFLKLGAAGQSADLLLTALPDEGLQATIDTLVQGVVISQLPLDSCAKVDRLIADVAPLPARNAADLISLFVEVSADRKGGKAGPFTICPA